MIVLDIEATGVNHQKHSILSLGALDYNNPSNRLYLECRAWEGAHMEDEALAVCGFTREEATDPTKQTEAQLIAQFLTWADDIEDQTFLGQNVSFDRDYVQAACERAGYNYPFAHRTVDTHTIAYMHYILHRKEVPIAKRHSALNIEAVCAYIGIPGEPEPHNALTGALTHAEMFSRLVYGKKLLPEFDQYEVPTFC
ncbi:MAG: Exonuclease RNase T and DNA polymerase III [Parcubacteria group bacterium GW2011_GWC2_42_11]|nr:MAG: Exonuclease RNase T and DNA polymerase III [Parcubacteria group bacterium GW2011_GWC2_42_11]